MILILKTQPRIAKDEHKNYLTLNKLSLSMFAQHQSTEKLNSPLGMSLGTDDGWKLGRSDGASVDRGRQKRNIRVSEGSKRKNMKHDI